MRIKMLNKEVAKINRFDFRFTCDFVNYKAKYPTKIAEHLFRCFDRIRPDFSLNEITSKHHLFFFFIINDLIVRNFRKHESDFAWWLFFVYFLTLLLWLTTSRKLWRISHSVNNTLPIQLRPIGANFKEFFIFLQNEKIHQN